MPILSEKGNRELYQSLIPVPQEALDQPTPSFSETFSAGYQFVRDEERSISWTYNNQVYRNRRDRVRELYKEGMDLDPYTDERGVFDYNSFAEDTGLIPTDIELDDERTEILRQRREQNQDVLDRGGGFAGFLGMASSYMGDPINLATIGVGGGTVGAAKSLTMSSRILLGARNSAAIGAATELAIQPMVYNYKQDIDSPYTFEQAATAVVSVALFSGVIGGGAEGLASYFGRAAAETAAQIPNSPFPRAPMRFEPPVIAGKPALLPTDEAVAAFKKQLIEEARQEVIGLAEKPISRGEAKKLRGELRNYEVQISKLNDELAKPTEAQPLTKRRRRAIDAEIKSLEAKAIRARGEVERYDAAIRAKGEASRLDQGILPDELQERLDDFITAPSTPATESVFQLERLAKQLRIQKGFRASELSLQSYARYQTKAINSLNEAKKNALDDLSAEAKKANVSGDTKKVDDIMAVMSRITNAVNDVEIKKVFDDLAKENIEADMAILQANDEFVDQLNRATLSPDDFVGRPTEPAPKAKTTPMERQSLDDAGFSRAFDEEVQTYNTLDKKFAIVDGQIVEGADDLIKALDEDLEGLESIMRCSRG
jgi:hypothetical protein